MRINFSLSVNVNAYFLGLQIETYHTHPELTPSSSNPLLYDYSSTLSPLISSNWANQLTSPVFARSMRGQSIQWKSLEVLLQESEAPWAVRAFQAIFNLRYIHICGSLVLVVYHIYTFVPVILEGQIHHLNASLLECYFVARRGINSMLLTASGSPSLYLYYQLKCFIDWNWSLAVAYVRCVFQDRRFIFILVTPVCCHCCLSSKHCP
jgi:hypothetical protein